MKVTDFSLGVEEVGVWEGESVSEKEEDEKEESVGVGGWRVVVRLRPSVRKGLLVLSLFKSGHIWVEQGEE